MALAAKKAAFVDEYLVDLNGAAAAVRAGYSPRTSKEQAWRLLREPAVADAVAVAQAERSKRTSVTADRVLRELARIAFSDIRDTVTWGAGGIELRDADLLDDDAAAAIAEVSETQTGKQTTRKIKLADKMAALRLLAAHVGIGAGAADEGTEDIGADEDPPVAEEA